MEIDDLIKICQPPLVAIDGEGDWCNLELEMKLSYFNEYKELLRVYGTGIFGNFLFLINPFESSYGYDYHSDIMEIINAYNILVEHDVVTHPVYLTYPNENGIFPIAATDNGDVFYAKINNRLLEDNKVILYDSSHSDCEVYHCNLIDVIYKWFNGTLFSKIIETPDTNKFITLDKIFN